MRRSRSLACASALILAVLGAAGEAGACGGLFCSASNPVNQAAERIVFAKNDDGTVTALIEILYEGPSESFAWVLPVPPTPIDVQVSSKQALDALQQASNPRYNFQTSFVEGCIFDSASVGGAPLAPGAAPTPEDSAAEPVEVVASGNVGPYDYVQIEVDPDDEDPAGAAIEWLEENGYDVGSLGPDLLRPYLQQEMNLLAFRLSKDSDTGSIRPVLINYPGERPLIPIRPTAVAAAEDMGILVWVLGSSRAVPTSYLHLELNEARIDWFNPNPTYNQVIIAAADEAGGQGFVTEQSGPAGDFAETVFPSWKEDQFAELRSGQFADLESFLQMAQSVATSHFYPQLTGFGGALGDAAVSFAGNQYDGFMEVLSDPDIVPLREGATAEQLNACVGCYFQVDVPVRNDAYPSTPFDPETDPLLGMDVQKFLDAMDAEVIGPLRETRALFEQNAQVTRLYTTMSADEMTVDPEFDLNPELEDVSNVHTATRVFECNGSDWTIQLPQGIELSGTGNTWPIGLDDEMPFNLRILQLSTSGEGEVLLDQTDAVVSRLIDLGLSDALPPEDTPDPGVDVGPTGPGDDEPTTDDDPKDSDDPKGNEDPEGNDEPGGGEGTVDPDGEEGGPLDSMDEGGQAKASDGGCAVQPRGQSGLPWTLLAFAAVGLSFGRRRRETVS